MGIPAFIAIKMWCDGQLLHMHCSVHWLLAGYVLLSTQIEALMPGC